MIKKVSNEYFLISFSPKVDSGGNRPSDHIGAPTFTCSVSKERRKTINIIIYLDFQSTKRARGSIPCSFLQLQCTHMIFICLLPLFTPSKIYLDPT